MREHKFRAWDKKNKRWIYSRLFGADFDCSPNADFSESQEDGIFISELELEDWQEYTGLFDKNGKEIYRGDIVSWSGKKYQIKWHERIAGFVMEFNGIERPDIEFESEVIGNIYENPDLLTPTPRTNASDTYNELNS